MSNRSLTYLFSFILAIMLVACSGDTLPFVEIEGSQTDTEADSYWQVRYAAIRRNYINDLFRSYGVGYGYNAFGEYASYNDVRDRIIDLDKLKQLYPSMIYDIKTPTAFQHVVEGKNSEQYLDNLKILAGVKFNIGFFQAQAKLDFSESDMKQDYLSFCSIYDGITMAQRHLEPYDLIEAARRTPEILSPGFRRYLDTAKRYVDTDRLDSAIIVIEEMFKTYGTHLIYHSELGGSMVFQCTVDRRSLDTRVTLKDLTEHEFSLTRGEKVETEKDSAYSVTQEQRKTKMIVKGGDASLAAGVLYIDIDSAEQRLELTNKWYQSVCFDPDNSQNNNVELIGFRLIPVSEFIQDPALLSLYQQITEKTADLENESFPRVYAPKNVRMDSHILSFDFQNADGSYAKTKSMVSVESGGEVIGEIDYELIDGREYSVFYPTIDGTVHHEGVGRCLQTDSICTITWTYTVNPLNSRVFVTPVASVSEVPYLYYTSGDIDVAPQDGVVYYGSYVQNELKLKMWDDDCHAGFKFGPFWLIRGCYATNRSEGYANYNTMIEDIPFGYEKVKPGDVSVILEAVRMYSGSDGLPSFFNQPWILGPLAANGQPEVYDMRKISVNTGKLPEKSGQDWGFIMCRRSSDFRYP